MASLVSGKRGAGSFVRSSRISRAALASFAAAAALLAVPQVSSAHMVMTAPKPRNNMDGIKSGPCGGVARTSTPATLTAGATVTVKWKETIAHQGCYQVAFSEANDQNFKVLKQIKDPAGGQGDQSTTVTIPAGVTCNACTLQVRQLMNGAPCPGDTNNPADPTKAAQGTYYSCADVKVVAPSAADAGAGTEDAGAAEGDAGGETGSSSGGTSGDSDGGSSSNEGTSDEEEGPGSRDLRAGAGSNCSVGWAGPSGFSVAAGLGLGLLAVARRRRR